MAVNDASSSTNIWQALWTGDEYAEGALETVAEEGNDSDIEAEENERYNRRPRAADGGAVQVETSCNLLPV